MTSSLRTPLNKHNIEFAGLAWIVVSALSMIALIGIYFSIYIGNDWNEIRLAPTLMWWHGANPYPGPGIAPITTWIYGPAPLLVYSPAALASNTFEALTIAFVINLILTVGPLVAVIGLISRTDDWQIRAKALLLAFAAWPACNLIYEQADNTAVFFGMVALALFSGPSLPGRRGLWLAAVAGGLALWSKPTEMGPVLGQIVLVALHAGKSAALRQTLRLAVAAGTCGIMFLLAFGADGIAYNMFVIPSQIPWDDQLLDKVRLGMIPAYILVYVLVPVCVWLSRARDFLTKPGPAQAAGWFFILSLPFNVAGFAILGGSANSLHACAYMIPLLALSAARTRSLAILSIIMVSLIGFQLLQMPDVFKGASPYSARDSLRQAEKLAASCRNRIYFPWNPLITFYSENKFYHVEDGIFARTLIGEVIDDRRLQAGLPEQLNWIAHRNGMRGMYAEELFPNTKAYYAFNSWTLISADGLLPPAFTPIPTSDLPTQRTP